jgi:hypothetical protein
MNLNLSKTPLPALTPVPGRLPRFEERRFESDGALTGEGLIVIPLPDGGEEVYPELRRRDHAILIASLLRHGLVEGMRVWRQELASAPPEEAQAAGDELMRSVYGKFALRAVLANGQEVVLKPVPWVLDQPSPYASVRWMTAPAADPSRKLTAAELKAAWEVVRAPDWPSRNPWPSGLDGSLFYQLNVLRFLGADPAAWDCGALNREVLALLAGVES